MKRFSEEINERLKLTKDSKISQKIDIKNVKRNDELYVVNIRMSNKEILHYNSGLVVCDEKLWELKWDNIKYYNLDVNTKYETIHHLHYCTFLFTDASIKYYEQESQFLIAKSDNDIYCVIFETQKEMNNFINEYDSYKDKLIDDFEKYIESPFKNRN